MVGAWAARADVVAGAGGRIRADRTVIGSADSPAPRSPRRGPARDAVLRLDDNGGVVALGYDSALPRRLRRHGPPAPTAQACPPGVASRFVRCASPWSRGRTSGGRPRPPWPSPVDGITRSYYSGQGYRYFVYPSWWGTSVLVPWHDGRRGQGAIVLLRNGPYWRTSSTPDGSARDLAKGSWNLFVATGCEGLRRDWLQVQSTENPRPDPEGVLMPELVGGGRWPTFVDPDVDFSARRTAAALRG